MAESTTIIPEGLRALLDTPALPGLGPEVRPGVKPVSKLRVEVPQALKQAGLAASRHELVLGSILLWHDHLHEAHQIAQNVPHADGSFLHAVMHRREPDFANSKYWWHRVGEHPCFPQLAGRAEAFLAGRQAALMPQLLPGGRWDPFAFVDACERATRRAGTPEMRPLLVELQQTEFEVFLGHLCREGT